MTEFYEIPHKIILFYEITQVSYPEKLKISSHILNKI